MQVTEHIHALRIPFTIPVSPEKVIDRDVYSYIVFGDTITLIDSGDLCRSVVNELGLPPFAANPLAAKSFASNLAAADIMYSFLRNKGCAKRKRP